MLAEGHAPFLFLCILFPLILLSGYFLASGTSSLIYTEQYSTRYLRGTSADLWCSYSVQLSPYQYSTLWILATLVYLALSSIFSVYWDCWVPPGLSSLWSEKSLKIVGRCSPEAYFAVHLSEIIVLCSLIDNVFKQLFPMFCLFYTWL